MDDEDPACSQESADEAKFAVEFQNVQKEHHNLSFEGCDLEACMMVQKTACDRVWNMDQEKKRIARRKTFPAKEVSVG